MKKKTLVILLSVLLIAAIGATVLVLRQKRLKEEEEMFLCQTPPVVSAPTETPAAVESEPTPQDTVSDDAADMEEENEDESSEEVIVDALPIEFLGLVTFKTGTKFEKTEIGGLSAITYDADKDVYYVLSDDRGRPDDARFYTVSIASDGSEVVFNSVTFLIDEEGKTVKDGAYDTEGIVFYAGRLFISSEGDAGMYPSKDPGVSEFALSGERIGQFVIPEKFLPDGFGRVGIRENKAFEPLAISPDGQTLTTAVENALVLDGPMATYDDESFCRLIQFDTTTGLPTAEYVYVTGAIPVSSNSSGDNGLVELIALDNQGAYLALERSYVSGYGNTIQLYRTSTAGATEVSSMDVLWDAEANEALEFTPMEKTLITTLADVGVDPDNVEGMALGPVLEDGRQVLVMVSDNNFSDSQITQFIVLAITLD